MPAPEPSRPRRPWWIPHFLGGIPVGIEEPHLRLLGFVAFAMLFENYDLGLMSAALPQIAAEYGLSNVAKGAFMGAIEMGALASFLVVPLADRIGRRRVLLISILGMSLGSFLTALAPSATVFAAFQVLTRTFATTATVVSFVMVAEEFPAQHRGWGIGMLGAVGATGFALSAAAYSQVERLPYGWRSIYAFGGVAILLLPLFRRRIQETRRFEGLSGPVPTGPRLLLAALEPLAELARRYPRRALLLGGVALLSTAATRPAFRFVSDFLQTTHGWSPAQYALLTVLGGMLGIMGNPIAGRLGDRFGRRRVGLGMLLPFPIVTALFYLGPASLVVPPWIAMVFTSMAAGVVVRTLATELFSTDTRGSGSGWMLMTETLGASGGLFLYSAVESGLASWGVAISLVSALAVVAGLVMLGLPETHGRELEAISGEAAEPDALDAAPQPRVEAPR